MERKEILVVVPAFNESGNIASTVKELLALEGPVKVLVIDDGSQDTTKKEAQAAGAQVISLPYNLGIGGAVQTGFKYAKQFGFKIAVQVDGDGQHDARFLNKIIAPLVNNKADMAIGSRFIPPYVGYQSSFIRRIGIHFFAYLISFLTRVKITDPTSGFRAYNKKVIDFFAEDYPHDFPEPEAIMMAKRFNARIVEIPVEMRERKAGSSSIRYLKTFYYMVKVTFAILLSMIKEKQEVYDDID